MPARRFEIDEITSRLVAGKTVCPYLSTCDFLDGPENIDLPTIRSAITHCGERYEECPLYIMKQKTQQGKNRGHQKSQDIRSGKRPT
jgi:hypothetical protein